ncbi:MAG: hypothetical protein ACT4OM_10635 [Actinomycetota bacterium]
MLVPALLLGGCAVAQALQKLAVPGAPQAAPTTTAAATTTAVPAPSITVPAATTTQPPAATTTVSAAAPVASTATTAPAPFPPTESAAAPAAPAPPPAVRSIPHRSVADNAWTPFATAGGITLLHPSNRVERVAFHESNHDGARQMEVLPSAIDPSILESRQRGTGSMTAADIVVQPKIQIRAPVTGTVKRGGSYVLYCDNRDFFVVIEPDDRPGWEVKVLHLTGIEVKAGDRVSAGETIIAPGPRILPFESQVDEISAAGVAWPHVHIEVVDPSIKDRPSPGGGC